MLVLLDAKTASKLCGVGLSLWYELSAAGRTPLSVNLNSKSLWSYDLLKLWAELGCPSRDSGECTLRLQKATSVIATVVAALAAGVVVEMVAATSAILSLESVHNLIGCWTKRVKVA